MHTINYIDFIVGVLPTFMLIHENIDKLYFVFIDTELHLLCYCQYCSQIYD